MTVDELARRVGITTRNVRLYQTRGLLPPPRRRGRIGYYDDGHAARLRLVARLQERGFSLAAIAELVRAWGTGRSLGNVLGLEEQVTAPWSEEREEIVTLAEVARRLPADDPGLIGRAVELGLLVPEGERVRVRSPLLLDVAEALLAAGVPLGAALDEFEKVRKHLGEVAEGFIELFARHVWQPFAQAGMPAEELPRITATLERLRPLASIVVRSILARALDEASGAATAEQVQRIARPKEGT